MLYLHLEIKDLHNLRAIDNVIWRNNLNILPIFIQYKGKLYVDQALAMKKSS